MVDLEESDDLAEFEEEEDKMGGKRYQAVRKRFIKVPK